MEWDWEFVRQIMPTLIEGLKITILATALGSVVAAVDRPVSCHPADDRTGSDSACHELCRRVHPRNAAARQLYFIFYVRSGHRNPPACAGRRRHRSRHSTYGTYAAGLSGRHRERAARTMGGGQGGEPHDPADLDTRDPAQAIRR